MDSIRYLLAALLLFFSGQSLALFMPAGGVQINTEKAVIANDEGC